MSRFPNQSQALSSLLLSLLLVAPVLAHKVEVSGDVAATLHIEPDDRPKAGVTSKVWFALTRRGGKIIALQDCNCQLAVYLLPHQQGTPPLLKPVLIALNAERYQGIPGAAIAFPKVGAYKLVLTGTAKPGADFKPFKLSYQITVSS